jgi:hypothetical protein
MGFAGELYLARFVSLQGRGAEAEALFQALLGRESEAARDAPTQARLHLYYGNHLAEQGAHEDAERELLAAAALLGGDLARGTGQASPGDMIDGFVALYRQWGRPDKVQDYEALRRPSAVQAQAAP